MLPNPVSSPADEAALRDQAQRDGVTHLSTGVAVVRDGKVLIVRRVPSDYMGGNYELPGGGVDDGESLAAAAIRELHEETGLQASHVLAIYDGMDYPTDKKPWVRQFNFLVEATGVVTLDPAEHDDAQWVDATSIQQLTISDEMKRCALDALELAAKHAA